MGGLITMRASIVMQNHRCNASHVAQHARRAPGRGAGAGLAAEGHVEADAAVVGSLRPRVAEVEQRRWRREGPRR